MEIIEIGNTCVCAAVSGALPRGKCELFAVAEEIFSSLHRPLFKDPEIAVYSNGASSLVFISRKAIRPDLHTKLILN